MKSKILMKVFISWIFEFLINIASFILCSVVIFLLSVVSPLIAKVTSTPLSRRLIRSVTWLFPAARRGNGSTKEKTKTKWKWFVIIISNQQVVNCVPCPFQTNGSMNLNEVAGETVCSRKISVGLVKYLRVMKSLHTVKKCTLKVAVEWQSHNVIVHVLILPDVAQWPINPSMRKCWHDW